jgi:transcription elongation factor Elf1
MINWLLHVWNSIRGKVVVDEPDLPECKHLTTTMSESNKVGFLWCSDCGQEVALPVWWASVEKRINDLQKYIKGNK